MANARNDNRCKCTSSTSTKVKSMRFSPHEL